MLPRLSRGGPTSPLSSTSSHKIDRDGLAEVDSLLHSVIDSQQSTLGRIDSVRNAKSGEEVSVALGQVEKEIIRGGRLVHKARRRLRAQSISTPRSR
jgi:hypothetical protein